MHFLVQWGYTCSVYILYNYTTLYQCYTNILHSYYIWQYNVCTSLFSEDILVVCIFWITIQLYTNVILTLYCIHTIFDSIMCTYFVHFLVQWVYTCIMCIFCITIHLYINIILRLCCIHAILTVCVLSVHFDSYIMCRFCITIQLYTNITL